MAPGRRSDKEWLYRAAYEGGLLDTVRVLLEEGDVDVNAALDDWGTTPLMFSTQKGHLAVMHYLLEHGAEVDKQDTNGMTALMYHCGWSENVSLDVVKFLVTDMKADVDAVDREGRTSLMYLCESQNVSLDVLKLLVTDMKADVDAVDNGGKTPLVWLCQSQNVSLDVFKFLVADMKADVNAVDDGGRTPLMYASDSRTVSLDVMKFLVTEAKADANAVDKDGRTVLMYLCQSQNASLQVLKFLVTEAKADVNAVDVSGKSALIQAAIRGDHTTVEKLLSLDADPTLRDKNYRTARDYAVRLGYQPIQHLLLSSLDNDQFISSTAVILPEQWVIPATEIEFGDYDNMKDIGGDFHGMWLDAEVVLKLCVSNSDDGNTPFHEQVASSEMYQELATRWADITKRKIELFVSEVDKSLTLLRDVDPDDLVTLLYHESQSQKYSHAQREIIQKAYDDLFTKRSTELFVSPPEWFIGWYELENEIEFARGGFGDVSRAKWLNSDVVVKRMRRDNDHVDRTRDNKKVAAQPPYVMIHSMKEMLLQCKADANKLASIQNYELLLERLEDVYAGEYDTELGKAIKAKLGAIVSAANECVAELPKQLPPVEGVKSVFRGFSLHRRIDRVLAEYFISPSSDVHQWKTKCSTMLQSLKAGE
ncbi:hypothetical protein KRP22_009772 [Phytophthora ramorum]|nr:putative ankyrin repeat protein [Phytophthora ramorum]